MTNNKECEQYEMDLTDYVRGDKTFLTREKQEALFAHLRKCPRCRASFFDWENAHAKLVSQAHHDKPETRVKLAELRARLKWEFLPPTLREPITLAKIGETAGHLRQFLAQHGPVNLPDLPDKINRDPYLAILSTGWLAKENKVSIDPDKGQTVSLTKEEMKRAQAQA